MSLQVTAILAAYNEEDIVGAALSHLISQGVSVHFIDHGSTDATLDEARRFEGRGVIGIESMPAGETVRWADVLRRKEALARELPGDWFIHHDADEFRESAWSGETLAEGIRRVDRLGFNAIDFEVLQFRPVHDRFRRGDDPLSSFEYFEPPEDFDRLQVKCWKRAPDVRIAASGGHDIDFAGRRVFPLRFLLRHYPVRTQAQGTRKVLRERQPRFDAEEKANGWHLQYREAREGENFLREPESLTRYDAEAVRARLFLEHRGVAELRSLLERERGESVTCSAELDRVRERSRQLDADLAATGEKIAALQRDLETAHADIAAAHHDLQRARGDRDCAVEERDRLHREVHALQARAAHFEETARVVQARVDELLASWSWRGTAPARVAWKRLRGDG